MMKTQLRKPIGAYLLLFTNLVTLALLVYSTVRGNGFDRLYISNYILIAVDLALAIIILLGLSGRPTLLPLAIMQLNSIFYLVISISSFGEYLSNYGRLYAVELLIGAILSLLAKSALLTLALTENEEAFSVIKKHRRILEGIFLSALFLSTVIYVIRILSANGLNIVNILNIINAAAFISVEKWITDPTIGKDNGRKAFSVNRYSLCCFIGAAILAIGAVVTHLVIGAVTDTVTPDIYELYNNGLPTLYLIASLITILGIGLMLIRPDGE